MSPIEIDARKPAERARAVILSYLERAGAAAWPGVDGLNVEDLLLSYSSAACGGAREQLLAGHPELAAELEAVFTHAAAQSPIRN